MNAQPHTHTLSIRDEGYYTRIAYGDQVAWPEVLHRTAWRRRRVARKLVRRHDRESRRAGVRFTSAVGIKAEVERYAARRNAVSSESGDG